jgi:hypothetical protein
LGINLVSIKSVNGYELELWIGLASYQVGFGVIMSDLPRFAGVCPADCWVTVVGCWATWRVSWLGQADGMARFRPIRLGNIENLLFSKPFINFKSI